MCVYAAITAFVVKHVEISHSLYLCVLIQDRVQPTLSSAHGEDPGGWRQGHRGMYIHALHSVLPQTHKQPLNPVLLVHNGEQSIPWVHSTFMSCVYTYTCMYVAHLYM